MDKILTILEDIHVHKNADIFVLKDKIIRKKVDILGGEIHNMSGHESLETFAHFFKRTVYSHLYMLYPNYAQVL